ncbi:MAG: hypothetical protein PHU36_07685 [Syntrophomonadaceae bacterium]|nr:hypothetical protein [Syntrophomonadaceae bacterium]
MVLALSATVASANNIQDTSLEAFFDNTMNSKLEKYHIPNATVSVVKDGEIVYIIWNRLASYLKGGRPDLVAVALDASLKIDPGQMGTCYSLGRMLINIVVS